jgi:signal transduction histidine kinase
MKPEDKQEPVESIATDTGENLDGTFDIGIPDPENTFILIVDDNPNNIQVIANLIDLFGFEISIATNGEQALSIIERKKPDLVLLDIMMPGMDGFEVCRRIKQNQETKEIPVIFLTAKYDSVDKIRGFSIGASDYIAKPFNQYEVLARIRTQIKLKKALDQLRFRNEDLQLKLTDRTSALIRTEKHAAFSRFIQGIVHNLRNPLSAMATTVSTARLQLDQASMVDERLEEFMPRFLDEMNKTLDLSEKVISRMGEMIGSLLMKGSNDQREVVENFDLNTLLNQELKFLEADRRFKHQVTKEIKLSNKKLPVRAKASEIGQIFENLVRNAIDAMYQQKDKKLKITSGKNDDYCWFDVTDNGPGISPEIQLNIFDPYFSTKPKEKYKEGDEPTGTGLGLYICLQIAETYGGRIDVHGEPGNGATFRLLLPRVR